MTLFIGIDQSVNHTGIAILTEAGSVYYLGLIEPKGLVNQERLAYIRDALEAVVKDLRFAASVMEGYSYNSVNKKYLLGEVGAVVKLALFDHSDKCFEAAPKQLKKFVCGKGSASKEEVMLAIEHQYGVVLNNDNLADAYGLARIGLEIEQPQTTMRPQLEVVKALVNKDLKKVRKKAVKHSFKNAV